MTASQSVRAMTLREARAVGEQLKTFVQQNQGYQRMHKHLHAIEELVRDMEAMTVSVRTQQLDMHDFYLPVCSAEGVSPPAGAGACSACAVLASMCAVLDIGNKPHLVN